MTSTQVIEQGRCMLHAACAKLYRSPKGQPSSGEWSSWRGHFCHFSVITAKFTIFGAPWNHIEEPEEPISLVELLFKIQVERVGIKREEAATSIYGAVCGSHLYDSAKYTTCRSMEEHMSDLKWSTLLYGRKPSSEKPTQSFTGVKKEHPVWRNDQKLPTFRQNCSVKQNPRSWEDIFREL